MVKALESVFPHHSWLPWKLEQRVHSGFWDEADNQKRFVVALGDQLGFKNMDDWYKLEYDHISKSGGARLISKHGGSRLALLKAIFPQHQWSQQFRNELFLSEIVKKKSPESP